MSEKEFNLMDEINKINEMDKSYRVPIGLVLAKFEEFIKRLKEELIKNMYQRSFKSENHVHPLIPADTMEEIIKRRLQKLAGDKLTGKPLDLSGRS